MGRDYTQIRVEFYLRHWKMLEENRNILTMNEIDLARLLFNSLPKLSEENLNTLKIKYYDTSNKSSFDRKRGVYRTCVPITDEVVAYQLGITIEQYRINKRIAEKELEEIMLKTGHELLHSKEKIFLKINNFFFVRSADISLDKHFNQFVNVGDVTLTTENTLSKKQVFDLSDDVVKQGVEYLEKYGFMREALDEHDLRKYEEEQTKTDL